MGDRKNVFFCFVRKSGLEPPPLSFFQKKQKKFQISLDICLLIGYNSVDSGGTVPLQETAF
jgi:hypothetical protein